MAQKRINITRGEAKRIRALERDLDDYTFRLLMTGGNNRLMRPERLENLKAGRGKLQPWEKERLSLISRNAPAIGALKERREDQPLYSSRKKQLATQTKDRAVGHALKDWLLRGKDKETVYDTQDRKSKSRQARAIRALHFLGIDPTEKHYYVRKVAT